MSTELREYFVNRDTKKIKQFLKSKSAELSDLQYSLSAASREGFTDVVELVLKDERVDPSASNNQAIILASENGRSKIVDLLLNAKNFIPGGNAIYSASASGNVEILKKLLEYKKEDPSGNGNILTFDPAANNNSAIIRASDLGFDQVIKILLSDPRVDPSDDDNAAIINASSGGHTKIVEMLLQDPRVDPTAKNNKAIRLASRNTNPEIIDMLLKYEREDPLSGDIIRVDPSVYNNIALRSAVILSGNTEIIKSLLSDPRVDPSDNPGGGYDHSAIFEALYRKDNPNILELLLFYPSSLHLYEKKNDELANTLRFRVATLRNGITDEIRDFTENFFIENYMYWFGNFIEKNKDNQAFIETIRESRNFIPESLNYTGDLKLNSLQTFVNLARDQNIYDSTFNSYNVALLYLLNLIVKEKYLLSDILEGVDIVGEVSKTYDDSDADKVLVELIGEHIDLCKSKVATMSEYEKISMISRLLKENEKLFRGGEYVNVLNNEVAMCKLIAISLFCADLRENFKLDDMKEIYKSIIKKEPGPDDSKVVICENLKNELFIEGLEDVDMEEEEKDDFELNKLMWSLHDTHMELCRSKVKNMTNSEKTEKLSSILGEDVRLFRKENEDDYNHIYCELLAISLYCADLRITFSFEEMHNLHLKLFGLKKTFKTKKDLCDDLRSRLFYKSLKRTKGSAQDSRKRQRRRK